MTASDVDREIEALARRQHGTFNATQAREAGATSRVVCRRVRSERWLRLDRGIYALPSHPATWQRQAMAATLAIEEAAVSHTTAARLHGLERFRPGRVHIVVPPATNHRTKLAVVHESTWARRTRIDGIPVVTLVDLLFQLAGVVPAARFRSTFGDAVVADRTLLPELIDRYVDVAYMRLPGIAIMRGQLDQHDRGQAPPESELERLLDRLLDQVDGLPPRRRQAPLPGWDCGAARVDAMIPDWRLIIEADGRRWHTRAEDFERDRRRDNLATAHGFYILRFTHRQLTVEVAQSLATLNQYATTHQLAA